ncbi:ribosomal protein S16 [Iris pallida]|uniref:Ribosomal protein S16 (Chloroplast) n=1 Tax=Iris pallida TaxID=29817 RepID=A0AAX6FC35_IRIPA|nr:ribosomal protein S16 [Iris pallida]
MNMEHRFSYERKDRILRIIPRIKNKGLDHIVSNIKQKVVKEKNFVSDRDNLGRKDSNLRVTGPKPIALPLGHAPFRFIFDTNKH